MSMSPENSRAERTAEERLTAAEQRPADPELAADWEMRRTLRDMETPRLPPELRNRVMQATRRTGPPTRWMGLAAAVVLSLGLILVLQAPEDEPQPATVSQADFQDLQLALATLESSARRTSAIAGRELADSLVLPNLKLDDLPYAPQLRQWIEPAPQPKTQKESNS